MNLSTSISIPLPRPVTRKAASGRYKNVAEEPGHRRVGLVMTEREYEQLNEVSEMIGVDITNLFRQLVTSIHKELCVNVPGPGEA